MKSARGEVREGGESARWAYAEHVEDVALAWRRAQDERHRFVVVFFGSRYASDTSRYASDTSYELFKHESLSSLLPLGEVLELGVSSESSLKRLWPDRARVRLSWSSARARLGSSEAALLIELDEGAQPDALAAAVGAVVGGGLVLISAPSLPPEGGALKSQLTAWPHPVSAVTHHFWSQLWCSLRAITSSREVAPGLWCSHVDSNVDYTQDDVASLVSPSDRAVTPQQRGAAQTEHERTYASLKRDARRVIDELTLNSEQREAVLTTLTALRREALCATALCASRGRGKSSALGLIAAAVLLEGEIEVAVTAPTRHAVDGLFARAREALELIGDVVRGQGGELMSARGSIRYHAPQVLWRREVKPSVLLVDEAAALPVPLLERVLERRPKVVFATTTQGYEGSGRGFSLRFRPLLQRRVRKLYEPKLTSPLRWSEGDPLESWMMRALMLDVDVHLGTRDLNVSRYHHQEVARDELAVNHELLREVFGLLVHAHYQTQPSDLWRILDAPQLTLHALRDLDPSPQHPRIIAVALVSLEGGLSSERAAELYEGRVRARGQLFAANLSLHLNCEEGATLKLARVVRIATLPSEQGRGSGSRLLEAIAQTMREREVDLIGSSFGSTARLARFWVCARFTPLRVGVKQNHTSGERSLLVARALSERGDQLLARLTTEALTDLPHQLLGPLVQLEPELVQQIFLTLYHRSTRDVDHADWISKPEVDSSVTLSERAWRALGAVIYGGRAYELALEPARQLTLVWLEQLAYHGRYQRHSRLTALGRLLIMKTLQRRRWLEVGDELNLSTSEAMRGLGVALELLFEQLAPPSSLSWCSRFGARGAEQRLCSQLLPRSLIEHSTKESSLAER